jgi:hypothetical protein
MVPFSFKRRVIASVMLTGLVAGAALTTTGAELQRSGPPDFSSHFAGWVGMNGGGPFYEPVPGMPPHLSPIVSDPKHPFIANGTGQQPTFRIPDLTNPNLKPWVKEHMKKDTDEVLGGKIAFTAQSSCWPSGVPFFMGYGGPDPIVFLQTQKDVWMVWREDNQARRIHMNVGHSADVKPSWYGESVGHYEGDTLVVDTIALNGRTVLDIYRTPHSEKLHVFERWKMAADGQAMEVIFTVEDEDAFHEPWTGMRRYRRVEQEPYEKSASRAITGSSTFTYPKPRRPISELLTLSAEAT